MTGRVCGFAPTDLTHTARLRRSAKLVYPYHPLFGQGDFEIIQARSDMLIARLPDGSRRGIPAWMFDRAVCETVREVPRPLVDPRCLLEIVDLLEIAQRQKITALNEHSSNTKAQGSSDAKPSPNKPQIRPGRGRQKNPGAAKGRVHLPPPGVDRSSHKRRSPKRRAE